MTRQNTFLLRDFGIEGVFVSKIHNAIDIADHLRWVQEGNLYEISAIIDVI